LTRAYDESFDDKVADVCGLYRQAQELTAAGERVITTDELSVQALERKYPGLPLAPGKVERREFEYIRRGTRSFIFSRDVASGEIIAPYCAATRKEEDFVAHIKAVIASDPGAKRWHFVVDNLDIHCSASLVELVAEVSGLDIELGKKGKKGILKNLQTRSAFLSNPEHKIVFHYTPKHCSWLNQIEIWFSILSRKLLRRGNFTSVEDLRAQVMAFVEHYNQTMAKPFKWTYQGKVLVA
jgi:hypothetical protein